MRHILAKALPLFAGVLLLAACSGGDDGGEDFDDGEPLDVGGIYFGKPQVSGVISENGFAFLRNNQNGDIYVGNLDTDDGRFSGAMKRYPSGGVPVSGSFSGTGSSRLSLKGTLADSVSLLVELNYSPADYELPSSLSTVSGTYTGEFGNTTTTLTISASDGSLSGQAGSCSLTGNVGLIDTRYNAYGMTLIRTCPGSSTSSTGLAFIVDDPSPRLFMLLANAETASVFSLGK